MLIAVKKVIAYFLQLSFIGLLIRKVYNNVVPFWGVKVYTNSVEIKNSIISSIYFRMYESAEVRLIKKYLPMNHKVVEIGSSIGAVSSIISQKTPKYLYLVEPNPYLTDILNRNMLKNSTSDYKIFNCGISGSNTGSILYFNKGETNLTSYISAYPEKISLEIKSLTLSEIVNYEKLDSFFLVCDIEGMEVEILKEDTESLKNCIGIIIELHQTEYKKKRYTQTDLLQEFLDLGFEKIDSDGHVHYLKNKFFH